MYQHWQKSKHVSHLRECEVVEELDERLGESRVRRGDDLVAEGEGHAVVHARALAVARLQEVLAGQLDDEQPHVLDVDADERAGGRRVHERPVGGDSMDNYTILRLYSIQILLNSVPECWEERLLDAVLVGPAHAGVQREEGAKDVAQLRVLLRHRVVPSQEEPVEVRGRDIRFVMVIKFSELLSVRRLSDSKQRYRVTVLVGKNLLLT